MVEPKNWEAITNVWGCWKAKQVAHAVGSEGDEFLGQTEVTPFYGDINNIRWRKKFAHILQIELLLDDHIQKGTNWVRKAILTHRASIIGRKMRMKASFSLL